MIQILVIKIYLICILNDKQTTIFVIENGSCQMLDS